MAILRAWALVFGLLWPWLHVALASVGFLNLEELSEMKYGIEILSEPVIRGQSKSDNIVTVSSKYKQNYECKLPAVAVKFHQDREEEQSYSGLGISDLLRPMEAAPCLIKTKDWWTYEFCYGKHIQQYHIEESEVKGDVLFLGYYQSEFDWNDETAKASKHHRLKRYHSQMYVNGSKCDLNGKSREMEVRFMCEEGTGDYIARVDEPQSCAYVLTVHTTRICHHPFLRPPSTGTPQSIKCHPALSPEQYVEYVKAQVSDTKRIVEELSEELKTRNLKTLGSKPSPSVHDALFRNEIKLPSQPDQSDEQSEEAGSQEPMKQENLEEEGHVGHEEENTDFWNKVLRPEDRETDAATDSEEELLLNQQTTEESQGMHNGLRYKIIRNPEDLVNFIADLKNKNKKQEEENIDAEQKDVQSSHSENDLGSKSETQAEDEKDEQVLLQEFEKELESILLPKSEISDNVKTEVKKEFDNIIDEAQEELETDRLKGEFDRKQASKSLATTLNKLIDKVENTANDKGEGTEPLESDEGVPTSTSEPTDKEPSDGRVKVRVTKIHRGSFEQKERKVREMSNENPQLRHIENVVKDLLEKEGLKAEGKIEIKILTTAEFGDEESFSEEDTKNLQDIIFNLLVQGTEEVHKERKRQQQLEDNYRFVWNQNQDDPKNTRTGGDTDDVEF
ncbi:protein OS-9 [Xenopus laevis]|uniref:Endoplasmic reticulum lectin n=2 Tax=Xenopus laevis TaxID=8355 RepID=A0A1L8HI75_XENLA|nr:protein OS-9 [Xenopus laevis]OCT95765.1 hypothetical protein XELAEV_18013452mg [Xenopus laevis]